MPSKTERITSSTISSAARLGDSLAGPLRIERDTRAVREEDMDCGRDLGDRHLSADEPHLCVLGAVDDVAPRDAVLTA
jgi:hypothetical protein